MKIVYALFMAVLLPFFQTTHADDFSRPSRSKELPVSYLGHIAVSDSSRQLNDNERLQIVRLFSWSYVTSIRKYKQDYTLSADTPVYILLKTNFPALAQEEGEGGIMLGKITRFFNRIPVYQSVVTSELKNRREGSPRCKD